jgi:hypothetical protein
MKKARRRCGLVTAVLAVSYGPSTAAEIDEKAQSVTDINKKRGGRPPSTCNPSGAVFYGEGWIARYPGRLLANWHVDSRQTCTVPMSHL